MAARNPRPAASILTGPYWRLGATGTLHVLRCTCGAFNHPPTPVCRTCRSSELAWTPVGGHGVVYSYGVDHQWAGPEPQVFALVDLDDGPGLRIFTTLVDCEPGDVEIGMAVSVRFREIADPDEDDPLFMPVFGPVP